KEWRDTWEAVHRRFSEADPKARVKWAGPDMSVRSSITARQMETWAHGQEIFDALGLIRKDTDRLRNVAHLGVNTYAWTFVNRGEEVPQPTPYVQLNAPSGDVWRWGEPGAGETVSGDAVAFCQVVAQTRNVGDTDLRFEGANATRWMEIAQCFAGPPVDPPEPGTRVRAGE
ncbi:MAG: maleylpyruvate isomerase family mycothiol-dependent enzyme, partial [Pseudomonadota bacterium]